MRVGVFGSRRLGSRKVYERLKEEIVKLEQIEMIVTAGEINGVCKLARQIAEELKIPLFLYFYDYLRFFKGAFERRSRQIMSSSDYFLIIHDGHSKGTMNELKMLEEAKLPYKYIKIQKEDNKDYDTFDWNETFLHLLGGDSGGK